MKNPNEICGIWHGENASAAITENCSIVFLRLEPELIAAVLKHSEHGTTGTVYGIGNGWDAHAIYRIINPSSGKIYCNDENEERLKAHGNDKAELDKESGRLIYTAYNGSRFELTLKGNKKACDQFLTQENHSQAFVQYIQQKIGKFC